VSRSPLPYDTDFAAELTRELWDKIMAGAPTGARPRKAATLILVDRSGHEPKVLLGKRHSGHKFMPGRYVFPGGRVEPVDRRMGFAGALDSRTELGLMACLRSGTQSGARALALAAIRETFEETGLLIGEKASSALPAPAGAWSEFVAQGVMPALDHIHFVGRAITPPRNRMRFDTFFLAADASGVAGRVEGKVHAAAELVDLVWAGIPEALASMGLVPITKVMLRELANRLALDLDRAAPTPVYATGRRGWERGVV